MAFIRGGRVEFSVLLRKTFTFPSLSGVMPEVLYIVLSFKYAGANGPYHNLSLMYILNSLDWLFPSFSSSAKCM